MLAFSTVNPKVNLQKGSLRNTWCMLRTTLRTSFVEEVSMTHSNRNKTLTSSSSLSPAFLYSPETAISSQRMLGLMSSYSDPGCTEVCESLEWWTKKLSGRVSLERSECGAWWGFWMKSSCFMEESSLSA
jgi:hypothetical protein